MEGVTILDTTGYSILESRPLFSLKIMAAVFFVAFVSFMIFACFYVVALNIGDLIWFSFICIILSFIVTLIPVIILAGSEDKSTTKRMEVYVEAGYKFDVGFLEEWRIEEKVTDNVYILERREFNGC